MEFTELQPSLQPRVRNPESVGQGGNAPDNGARFRVFEAFSNLGERQVDVVLAMRQPNVVVFGNLLSDWECDALIDLSRPHKLALDILPKKGCGQFFAFANCEGGLGYLTLHSGSPVASGEKWGATQWLRLGEFVGWSG